ncbi:IS110 family transposase [Streptacidiphilus sp. ASG 303]|uniref:IS110 family transposase n=1 Tax=Streptacidiphilus sp. ASG 303 TaxID=2896847 RepID=UPI001E3F8678|nr:IS110 family transposase [Streptacidiphilus sp. ASG 303]MCD0486280.1 IS110 family transposase [Streptacidiphilus sp. ASG 303]
MSAIGRGRLWVGIDAGKGHHWATAVDETGATVWSKKIDNDESAILAAIGEVLDLADQVRWGIDLTGTASALLLALLAAHGQQPVYVPGRTVNRMSGAYRGEAKTDARDAYVIAESVRHRRDFTAIDVPVQLVADLALLTGHRTDLVADRVRMVNRLRDTLTGIFPALERAFDYSAHKGALVLLTCFQTPAALRRRGEARLSAWLAKRGVRGADHIAARALESARAQHTRLPSEQVAAQLVADLAEQILALDERLRQIDKQIATTFRSHPQAAVLESLPGIGPILGAEFLVAAGDLAAYANAGHLASAAGLVPVPRDSGRRTGNLHRPRRYSRRLRRVFYLSAQTSIIKDGPNRDFYLKKRGEGCKHVQAIIALARRRVDVLWALLRDNRIFSPDPPAVQTA